MVEREKPDQTGNAKDNERQHEGQSDADRRDNRTGAEKPGSNANDRPVNRNAK